MKKQKVISKKGTKRWIILIAVVLIITLLFDVFMVGNIGYVAKWIQCGRQPVVVHSNAFLSVGERKEFAVWEHPGFFDVKGVFIPFVDSSLFCNVNEFKSSVSSNVPIQYK